jgi:predicted RNA binding protein YcfA (HicA-like mRNA interferase family)
MGRRRKLLERILGGRSDANIHLEQTQTLLERKGFSERIVGSHHIFARNDIPERLNLQPSREGSLKRYQVRQLRELLVRYGLDKVGDD